MQVRETGRELEKAGSVAGAHSGLTQVSGSSEKAGESLELWEVSGGGVQQSHWRVLEPKCSSRGSLSSQHPVYMRTPAFWFEEQPTGRVTWAQMQWQIQNPAAGVLVTHDPLGGGSFLRQPHTWTLCFYFLPTLFWEGNQLKRADLFPPLIPAPRIVPVAAVVQSPSCVQLFVTPWTVTRQALLSSTISCSSLGLMSFELMMLSSHLILCRPLFLLPSIFPSLGVFSSELVLRVRWPNYWSFSFSISPSNEYSGLVFFWIDWFEILAVQGTLKNLLQHHSSKASILWYSAFSVV